MRSDEREQRAVDALATRRAAFRAAVETAHAQARAFHAAHGPRSDDRARETALELGQFAGGRVDPSRFAALTTETRVLGLDEETAVRRSAEVMDEVLAHGDGLFTCDVPPGGDLHAEVEAALAEAGRAFGAAFVCGAVKAGSYRPDVHGPALRAFPYRRWSRAERLLAPPLVVTLDGADLHAGMLAGYLDGQQKIVLLVRGSATPAPLARVIAPRCYVVQATDADALAAAAAFDGPAIAALVPASAARFVHDPAAGPTLAQRLTGVVVPTAAPRAAVGGHSGAQQREELMLLAELAAQRAPANAPADAPAAAAALAPPAAAIASGDSAVNALADWLLSQAGLASAAAAGSARP